MPTNPIGTGTCNLSFNAPVAWRTFLGRLAFTNSVSMGELLRRLVARAVHVWSAARHAATAEQADNEALAVLRKAIADGITEADRPAINQALALIEKSALADRKIAADLTTERTLES